jgi:hypothetical protein
LLCFQGWAQQCWWHESWETLSVWDCEGNHWVFASGGATSGLQITFLLQKFTHYQWPSPY